MIKKLFFSFAIVFLAPLVMASDASDCPELIALQEIVEDLEVHRFAGGETSHKELRTVFQEIQSNRRRWDLDAELAKKLASLTHTLGAKYAVYTTHKIELPEALVLESRDLLKRAVASGDALWPGSRSDSLVPFDPIESNFHKNHFMGAILILSEKSEEKVDIALIEKVLEHLETQGWDNETQMIHVLVSAQRRLAELHNLPKVGPERSPAYARFEEILQKSPVPPKPIPSSGWWTPNKCINWMFSNHYLQFGSLLREYDLIYMLRRASEVKNDAVYAHLATLIAVRSLFGEPIIVDRPRVIAEMSEFARSRIESRNQRRDGLGSEPIILVAYGTLKDFPVLEALFSEMDSDDYSILNSYIDGKNTPEHLRRNIGQLIADSQNIRAGKYTSVEEKLLLRMADRLGLKAWEP